jgi:hypothetical protein
MERAPSQDLLVIRRNHDTGVVWRIQSSEIACDRL